MPESEYPEHEKLAKIAGESQAIGEFLEWAELQGVRLLHWRVDESEETCPGRLLEPCVDGKKGVQANVDDEWKLVAGSQDCRVCGGTGKVTETHAGYKERWPRFTDALAEFFEIDQAKIEQEKRAMIDSLSRAQG